jgi:hypothetical protein
MSKSKRPGAERRAELRALLECRSDTERTTEAARRLVAERDQLRARVADLERALAAAWSAAGGEAEEVRRAG